MSAALGTGPQKSTSLLTDPWLWGGLGFLAMYAPIYMRAANDIWQREEHAHGSMILLIAAWLLYQKHQALRDTLTLPARRWPGLPILALGACMYLLGRATQFSIFEFASQMLMVTGGVWLLGGLPAMRIVWFPVLFLIFMIPLPGNLVDFLTGTLKQWVSFCVEWVLYAADYPIARTGVMLTVGHYKLQVADACSGLHSMFTLTAMGMLVMYIKQRESLLHNGIMVAAILPIAFIANVIRVLALVLITYHEGDEAGQGFMHGAAGIVLIVVALLSFIGLDGALHRIGQMLGRSPTPTAR